MALLALTAIPVSRLGGEFLPPLFEGDLLYMPSALPGLSPAKAAELLQQTDRLIATVPEVKRVFGKIGRAETATDPAPLEMVETTVQLKPRSEWRPGMTPEKLVEELDRVVQLPGLANIWIPPIRNRIDMLATGIKSPLGIKVSGNDLAEIEKVAQAIERVVKDVPGATSVLAERVSGGRYIDVTIDRAAAGRYGLNIVDVQSVIGSAVGGETVGETIEGRRRFPISVRYPRELRDSVEKLQNAADRDRGRGADHARHRRADRHLRRPADAAQRERAARGLDLRRHPRPRPRFRGERRASRRSRARSRCRRAFRSPGRASSSSSSGRRSGSSW